VSHAARLSAKQRRFIAIARAETNGEITLQRRSQKTTILSPFIFFVTTEPDVVAAFLRGCRRSIAMNGGYVEKIGLMKRQHRVCKNGVKAAIGLPLSKRAINARVMNFRTTVSISF